MELKETRIEGYPLKVVGATTLSVVIIVGLLVAADYWVWPHHNILDLLFPFAVDYFLIGAALLWIIFALATMIFWQTDYGTRKSVVFSIYAYALTGLLLLTLSVISGGGLVRSPFSAFFPVGIAISIMATSKWKHVVAFSTFTVAGVIITALVCNDMTITVPPNNTTSQSPYLLLFYAIFTAALVIGAITGALRLSDKPKQ